MHEEMNEYADESALVATELESVSTQAHYIPPAPIVELESLYAWARLFAAQRKWQDQMQTVFVCFAENGELQINRQGEQYRLTPQKLEVLFDFIKTKNYSLREILMELNRHCDKCNVQIAHGLMLCLE